jgi:hypothetical protein
MPFSVMFMIVKKGIKFSQYRGVCGKKFDTFLSLKSAEPRMGTLSITYHSGIFNKLPHIDEVAQYDVSSQVLILGDLIVDLGLQDYIALHRIHKHFDVSEKEKVVMKDAGGYLRLEPCFEHSDYLPYMFAYIDNAWRPLQFVNKDFPGVEYVLNKIHNFEAEIATLTKKIVEFGIQDKIGLCVNYMKYLPQSYDGKIEETYENRVQEFRIPLTDTNRKNVVMTFWSFGPDKTFATCGMGCFVFPGSRKHTYTHGPG